MKVLIHLGFFSNDMIHLTCHLFVQFDYTETVFNNSKCYLECHQINWRLFLIDTCRFISSLIGFTGVLFVQKYCLLFSLHLLNYESKTMYIVFILKCALFFMSLYKIFPLYFFFNLTVSKSTFVVFQCAFSFLDTD